MSPLGLRPATGRSVHGSLDRSEPEVSGPLDQTIDPSRGVANHPREIPCDHDENGVGDEGPQPRPGDLADPKSSVQGRPAEQENPKGPQNIPAISRRTTIPYIANNAA